MAVVAPFRGIRYNPDKIENLEEVVTPPYDVINEEEGASFLDKNPYSMIQLDLRNTSQEAGSEEGRYQDARSRFDQWQDDGVLIRDREPAIYLYYIDYTHPSGRRLTRKGLVALVGLAEFEEGIVKPHEKTFDGVIADRLELMDECRAQFSQVFSIYSDPEQFVIQVLENAREEEPVCVTRDHHDNTHTLWRVTDSRALALVHDFFVARSVYIADGHHRYTTALACRRRIRERNPDLPPDSPFNFIMMYLCASEDQGLSVLPTHRLVRWPGLHTADQVVERLRHGFSVQELGGGSRETLVGELLARMEDARGPVFGFYHAGEDRAFLLAMLESAADDPHLAARPPVLRRLDVVILSDLLLDSCLGLDHDQCLRQRLVSYYSDPDEALDVAVKEAIADNNATPLLFLLNPTPVQQVLEVADKGEIMPHKSTYFYPKILTGLLINKLDSEERIPLATT